MLVISSLKRVLLVVIFLGVTPAISYAQGCPPWMKCGKKRDLIIPDSGGYDSSVAAATSSSYQGSSSYDVTQPLNVNERSSQLAEQLVDAEGEAKAKAATIDLTKLQNSRAVGNSIWVLDRTGTER